GSSQFSVNEATQGWPVPLSAGQASTPPISLPGGSYTIRADYLGTANFAANSGTLPGGQTVNPAQTSTAVASAPNPATFGQAVSVTATVTSSAGVPGGLVQFVVDNVSQGSPMALNGS